MIKAIQILEEYEKMCKNHGFGRDFTYTIFKNPTLKEIREVEDEGGDDEPEVRFIADNATKDVYIFTAFLANHAEARACLGLKCSSNVKNKYICGSMLDGIARRHGSSLIMFASDMMTSMVAEKEYRDAILSQDWSWVERYVKVADFLDNLRSRFRK